MADRPKVVYSTVKQSVTPPPSTEPSVPAKIVAKLRIEKAGRGGKTVTVIDNLPDNKDYLAALAKELKQACGAGGTSGDGRVELQGDRRERVRALLTAKGYTVKG
jgi:translation initiation factor 1